MAYNGYLIKLKGGTAENLPFTYVALESYQITPNQRMEAKANRATTGLLHRTTVSHTASKVEFETPPCTNREISALKAMLARHFTSALERKLLIEYSDPETDTYKEGTVYMPDAQYKICRVDNTNNIVHYDKVRYAFIEY